jgi:ribosomal protein S18 acetylase RimI-like enzyme
MLERLDRVAHLGQDDAGSIVAVLCDAFAGYPVMRFVLGPGDGQSPDRLHRLVSFFLAARLLRREAMFGVFDGADLVAVATTSDPHGPPSPPELAMLREEVWRELGADARARYEAYGAVAGSFFGDRPRVHLNMLGVRNTHQGRGLGRRLLEAVHSFSQDDPRSEGVSLTTEDPRNVAWYEAAGYEVVGHAPISDSLESWGLFRSR